MNALLLMRPQHLSPASAWSWLTDRYPEVWGTLVAGGASARHALGPQQIAPEDWATARHFALAAVDQLHDDLDRLLEPGTCAPHSSWVGALLEFLRDREAVEGVRVLLLDTPEAPTVAAALGVLDRRAERLLGYLPLRMEVADEWLWQAKLVDPDCWWVTCAAPPPCQAGSG